MQLDYKDNLHLIGKKVLVTLHNGNETEGKLIAILNDRVDVRLPLMATAMIPKEKIKEIKVL